MVLIHSAKLRYLALQTFARKVGTRRLDHHVHHHCGGQGPVQKEHHWMPSKMKAMPSALHHGQLRQDSPQKTRNCGDAAQTLQLLSVVFI